MNSSLATPAPSGAKAARQSWIDILRGTSIVLVILMHTASFSGYADSTTAMALLIQDINHSVAPFRMEVMFLLSGFFVHKSLSKGASTYYSGKLKNIFYPFIVWSVITFSINMVGAQFFGGRWGDWADLLRLALGSTDFTWFLYDLFLFYLITPLLRKYNLFLVVGSALLIALLLPQEWLAFLPGYGPNEPGFERPIFTFNDKAYYFIYFFIGDYMIRRQIDLTQITHKGLLALSSVTAVAVLYMGYLNFESKTSPIFLPLVLLALPIIFKLSVLASKSRYSEGLAYVGRNSIVFYLVHYPLFMVLIFLLKKAGIVHTGVLFSVMLVAGLIVPYLVILAKNSKALGFINILFAPRASSQPSIKKVRVGSY